MTDDMPKRGDALLHSDPDGALLLERDGSSAIAVIDDPIDHLEPLEPIVDPVRQAQVRAVTIINQFGSEMLAALEGPDASIQGALVRLYGIGYALGCNFVGHESMSDCARRLGVVRATLSKQATSFCVATGLEPSWHMKRGDSRKTYATARRDYIANGKLPDVPQRGRRV